VYSDVSDPGFNTAGQKFLRGYQVTGTDGVARFTTIYPGWYRGRAVHIHFKIRSSVAASSAYEFTSQLFFDDSLTDQVHAGQPYVSKGQRDLRNSQDGIYNQGGSQLVLNVSETADGYAATFDIALDTT
jgi:protocatechuate 3,4-dioxygenase beta subunit